MTLVPNPKSLIPKSEIQKLSGPLRAVHLSRHKWPLSVREPIRRPGRRVVFHIQGYLVHMKTPTPLGLPQDPRHQAYGRVLGGGRFLASEVLLCIPKVNVGPPRTHSICCGGLCLQNLFKESVCAVQSQAMLHGCREAKQNNPCAKQHRHSSTAGAVARVSATCTTFITL